MTPTNISYLGISGYVVFWVVTALAAAIFFHRIYQLLQYMFLGEKELGFRQLVVRGVKTAAIIFGQWCQLKNLTSRNRASIGHAFIAWGFFFFALFYFIFIILGFGFGLSPHLEHSRFYLVYTWVLDFLAVMVVIGALWGIWRRFVVRPARLKDQQTIEAAIILFTVLCHPFTHLFKEATAIALGHPPAGLGAHLPPVSQALSHLFVNDTQHFIQNANISFFWAHWLVVLFVLCYIPYSRYLHIVASIFNIYFRTSLPKGALKPIDLEEAEHFGADNITNLTWKQNLDLYACVICGQCQDRCPAFNSGKPLNPKKVIQDLKTHLLDVGPALVKAKKNKKKDENAEEVPAVTLAGNIVTEEELWSCTTCYACVNVCPVSVNHLDKIIDLRRNLVMERSQMPDEVQQSLQSLTSREHPWRGTMHTRIDWTEGLDIKVLSEDSDVDILYWVGCTAALEDRNNKVAIATAKIMKEAGVNFGILGAEEACCGEPARRMGDEYLFQTLCEKNIETMNSYGIKKIVTACPHCFNTISNEYPQFNGNFEVVHHSQFILELIKSGKIKLDSLDEGKTVTYHDSCYLGRYNGIFNQPRDILGSIGNVRRVEMYNRRYNSFCCGGGGGHMWMEEEPDQRVNARRTDQVIETGADIVSTACPYCLAMFEDGIKNKSAEETLKAYDISELVLQAMQAKAKV